ncbi:MAG TPA: ABC transporter ATP-binding protein [Ramlibacter sp.]|nr:ABC transporter ATP-binding protein [Ramlibacter sp.]
MFAEATHRADQTACAHGAPLLSVANLTVELHRGDKTACAISDVSFSLDPARTLCIVGESGSGKSVTAMAIMRLLAQPALQITDGEIRLDGRELVSATEKEMAQVRGRVASMVFQDPMSALNPVLSIGRQLGEPLRIHQKMGAADARRRSIELLELVGLPSPETALGRYPHQLSGGQRQRVLIAMALACEPKLLIADEPTTALDVTTQAQILALLAHLQKRLGMAIILITHDLGVVAEMADEVIVMYGGRIAEKGSVADIFERPAHPYTQGLLKSIPPFEGATQQVLPAIAGIVPSLFEMPPGCAFAPRCPHARNKCTQAPPPMVALNPLHAAACVRLLEVGRKAS